ncbi:MAG: hypothetical protein GF313_08665 [Caldithrix sp.]|nr:hypothetical protein [Caldithrix sp.]
MKNELVKVRRFFKISLVATITTYFLIFVGGLVRVSGAGLGCPDWPKCFGRWIPPTHINQVPDHIDASMFNFTLAWIEYINRLIGVIVGLLILITAVYALKNMRAYRKITVISITALILVALQGWQGSRVVASALEPITVTVHMLLAFLIVSLLLYASLKSYFLLYPQKHIKQPASAKIMIFVLYVVTIVQVVIGTQLRSQIETINAALPLLEASEWLSRLGPVNQVHIILGILMLILSLIMFQKVYDGRVENQALLNGSLWTFNGLIILQLFVGSVLFVMGLPALMQVIHLWLASFMVGAILIIFTTVSTSEKELS